MARRIAVATLQASTLDILNVIRQNASYDYQQNVPEVTKSSDIPKVGEVIYGTPAFANQFLNALINRIAIVRVQSATFNNPYARLKKGLLDFGETIEDIFVSIANVVEYTPEKGAQREFKRTLPDVKSAFHTMNWRVMYPVTIQDNDLKLAFLSVDGVTNLITKIVDSVYQAAEYDEFLLFKYLIIKAVAHGKMKPVSVGDGTKTTDSAIQFRGISNKIQFMSNDYNEANVKTNTPRERQAIFMDAMFNAQYDVDVLASAFNMDKADFMGQLYLVDSFSEFDNDRFEIIRDNSDGIEEVTTAELNLMKDVKAIIVDENWFQMYDNMSKFTEQYVSSGLYWNYFYHEWKTVSSSPFANAVVFVNDTPTITNPATITVEIVDKSTSEEATTLSLSAESDGATLQPNQAQFVQTETLTTAGIGVHPFGAYLIPAGQADTDIQIVVENNGDTYTNATTKINASSEVGTSVELTKQ